MQVQLVRDELRRRVRQVPFRPFIITLDSGDRLTIEHPENIAFDPGDNGKGGSTHFYVIGKGLSAFSTFDKVTHITFLDEGAPTGQ